MEVGGVVEGVKKWRKCVFIEIWKSGQRKGACFASVRALGTRIGQTSQLGESGDRAGYKGVVQVQGHCNDLNSNIHMLY